VDQNNTRLGELVHSRGTRTESCKEASTVDHGDDDATNPPLPHFSRRSSSRHHASRRECASSNPAVRLFLRWKDAEAELCPAARHRPIHLHLPGPAVLATGQGRRVVCRLCAPADRSTANLLRRI